MAQHDYNIANQGFPATRADINNALAAIVSNNSGDTEPTTTFANQWWYETDTNILYIRNEANDAWITVLTLDQGNDAVSKLSANEIEEAVAAAGVTIDGLLVKDKVIGTTATPSEGVYTKAINGGQIGGRRNILYNGGFSIGQRGTSFTGVTTSQYTLDRWNYNSTNDETVTIEQASDHPTGAGQSLKVTVTTADASITGFTKIEQKLEGFDVQQLRYGTASAKSVTISFWVKSSVTGDAAITLYSYGGDDNIGSTITINSANTWEKKTVTFVGETGSTINNDNTVALILSIGLSCGSAYTTTDNTSWGTYSTGRLLYGQTLNVLGTTSATFQLADVQLEVGSVATEFEHRSYGEELALCQRYYYTNQRWNIWSGYVVNAENYFENAEFPVTMRAVPSISAFRIGSAGFAIANPTIQQENITGFYVYSTCNATTNSGYYIFNYNASAEL